MNPSSRPLTALVLLIALGAALPASAGPRSKAATAPRLAAPEHARLTALVGAREMEITFWFKPDGPGATSKGTSTIRALHGGLFVEEKLDGTLHGVPFTTLAWTGFNTYTQRYEATRIASTNTIQIHETGAFDDAAGHFELKAEYPFAGDTWRQRTVIKPAADGTMTATSYLSYGNVPEWKGVEIRYARPRK